jgi:hypothetical protein
VAVAFDGALDVEMSLMRHRPIRLHLQTMNLLASVLFVAKKQRVGVSLTQFVQDVERIEL